MPLTDAEWEALSNAYNAWIDDVGNALESLADAAQDAERSVEGATLAGGVLRDLRRRVLDAIHELAERTTELTLLIGRLFREP
ncbi:MAG TPA: hypothetical protein VGR51_00100 [Thermoplasmata archaeon]|jgi:hypothetical protein|nr:hypothetical protein [Thermoplasmata archaeon]